LYEELALFSFVVEEALKHDIHLETSYAYDIEIIKKLYEKKKITKEINIICNGYKQKGYTRRIVGLCSIAALKRNSCS
jgi:arginine decarboxylase